MNTSPVRPIQVDDQIKDNDPRMTGRTLKVTGFESVAGIPTVICKTITDRPVKVALTRIYLDDKERRTGFSRIA